MSYQSIERETRGPAAWVWLNRPAAHNAFDEAMIADLTDVFTRLQAEDAVRVIVLAGRGQSFSAGADLKWMERAAAQTKKANLRDALAMAGMLKTIASIAKPVVARVQGAAFGGGAGLAAVCDIAIASAAAEFALSEVRFGLIPATIGPYVVAAIGRRQASRYFLTGERISAAEACRIGLAHEVCPPEALDERVGRVVAALAAAAPKAQAAAKAFIRRVAGKEIDERLIAATAQTIATLRTTPEAREGIQAFLEKRRPSWQP